jgi:hypothetical protein
MPKTSTIQSSLVKTLYTFGSLYKIDLIRLLDPYSKAPNRYIRHLITKEYCQQDDKTGAISLTQATVKSYSKTIKFKASKNLIDGHDFISSQVLLWYLENQKVESFAIEKRIDGTSLQADLYIRLFNGYEIYVEADTGSERVTELRNKILNYSNLEDGKSLVIIITQTETNYKNLIELTENKPLFKVYLDNNLNELLEGINYTDLPVLNANIAAIQDNFNLNKTITNNTNINLTLDKIQKLITSI